MNEQGLFPDVRIVLVETSHPGNIGAAARAMKNMGVTSLYLVNPGDFPSEQADGSLPGFGPTIHPVSRNRQHLLHDVDILFHHFLPSIFRTPVHDRTRLPLGEVHTG